MADCERNDTPPHAVAARGAQSDARTALRYSRAGFPLGRAGLRGRIFISYRRDDAAADARSIRDRLARKFGESKVFMDVDNLFAGQRFDEELDKALSQSDVLVAIMGRRWVELLAAYRKAGGQDFVCAEVGGALKRSIPVIPVLVGREGQLPPLPRPDELPAELRDVLSFQKHNIAHETFGRDVDQLVAAIGNIVRARRTDAPWKGLAVSGAAGIAAATLAAGLLTGGVLWFSQSGGDPVAKKAATEIDASAKKARDSEAGYRTPAIDIKTAIEPSRDNTRGATGASGENIRSVIEGAAARRMQWVEKQATQGDVPSMNTLGAAYEEGLGVPKNPQAALDWYRKAADRGSEEARAKLKKLKTN